MATHVTFYCAQDADLNQERFVSTPFWELFEMPFAEGARPWEACQDVASRGGEFVIHGVRVVGKYERGSFTMRFRCADRCPYPSPRLWPSTGVRGPRWQCVCR